MIVYMTQGQKTVLSRITVEGLPLHYLSVGRGYFARRRALRCLRQLYDSGVRRCICADVYLLSLAKQVDITSYPVLPLRLALLDGLLDVLCPGGLQNAAAVLRCGPGGEETARAALTVLARRARYVQLDMEDPAALATELLYRWGIAAGGADGGARRCAGGYGGPGDIADGGLRGAADAGMDIAPGGGAGGAGDGASGRGADGGRKMADIRHSYHRLA